LKVAVFSESNDDLPPAQNLKDVADVLDGLLLESSAVTVLTGAPPPGVSADQEEEELKASISESLGSAITQASYAQDEDRIGLLSTNTSDAIGGSDIVLGTVLKDVHATPDKAETVFASPGKSSKNKVSFVKVNVSVMKYI